LFLICLSFAFIIGKCNGVGDGGEDDDNGGNGVEDDYGVGTVSFVVLALSVI
jgi:hypothetical protein